MNGSLLQRLASFSRHRYRLVFVCFAVVLAVAGALASRLRFDTDVLNLLPRKDPVINAYLETLEEFGTFDYLMVVIRVPAEVPVDPYESYADELAARLERLEYFDFVEHRIGDPEELLEQFFPRALFFLDAEGRERLSERLSSDGIRRRVEEVRRQLSTPQGLVVREILKLDPIGLSEIFLDRIQASQGAMAVDWTSGYYLSQDRRLLLILAKPSRPPQDIAFDREMVAAVDAEIAASRAGWGDLAAPGMEPPTVKVGGAYVTAMTDAHLIQQDMMVNMATSMVLVLALFLFAFRRFGPLLYALFPLLAGLILTFGFSAVAFGVLSSATSGTAALLIGLGIDFIIVSYGRFVEERRRGADLIEGMRTMMGSSGRAVVIGAVTTAATFYAFTFTDFQGLRQMGILTGTGILFCMISVLLLLPALLAWSEDHHHRRDRRPNLFLHSFGTDRVIRFSLRRPGLVLALGAVLSLAAAAFLARLEFQDSWRAMRPAGNPGVEVEQEVARRFKSDFDFMMLVLSGREVAPLLEWTDEVTARAQQLVDDGVMNAVNSASTFIPPPARQREALAWLEEGRESGRLDIERIRADFERTAREEGLSVRPFEHGLELLEQALAADEPIGVEAFATTGQARRLLDRLLHKRGDTWKSVVYLYPPAEVWRRTMPPEAAALAEELGENAILTGANVVNQNMRQRVRRDAWIAAILGTSMVLLLLWADFRNFRAAALAMVPLAIGVVWMLGAMAAFGIAMNFMNIFVTTMIIGIGVDYGLHMVHRYREVRNDSGRRLTDSLLETGNAIVVAALSTIAGFGSLSLSHYPGLRSTGYVAILGALATAVVAVTLLPAFLALRERRLRGGP